MWSQAGTAHGLQGVRQAVQTLLHVAWQLLVVATVQLRPLLLLPMWPQVESAHGPQAA